MKCFNHPNEEAVGTCAKCGRGICHQCIGASTGTLICKECLQTIPSSHVPNLKNKIGAFLGWLGVANFIILEFWLLSTYFSLIGLPAEPFISQIYIASIVTTVSAIMLICGNYLMIKNRPREGGIINLMAGIAMAFAYTYFAFLSKPQLLNWLGITGYLLLAPALISGAAGIALKK